MDDKGPDFDEELDKLLDVEPDVEVDGKDEEEFDEPNSVWYIEHIKTAFFVLRILPYLLLLIVVFYLGMTINCAGEYEEAVEKNNERLHGD